MDFLEEVKKDNARTRAAALEERKFDIKSEKFHRGQKELLPGRNFLYNTFRYQNQLKKYRENFDNTFPDAPGAGI